MENKMITLDDITSAANENYLKFLKDGQIKSILRNIGLFADHTIDNDVLILLQNPNATCVKRLTEWNFYKRNIKKNEKAIKIISHHIYSNNLGGKEKDGKIYVDGIEKLKVEVGYVFDISQTEGKNYEYFNTNKENIAKYFDNVKSALEHTAKNYDFVYEDCDENYKIDKENNKIFIKDGMTLGDTIDTLIRVVAEVALDARRSYGISLEKNDKIRDIEIAGTIYAVNSKLGLDLPEFNFDDVQTWTEEDLNLFKSNLQKIRSASKQIIANVENSIEYAVRNLAKEKSATKEEDKEETTEETEKVKENEKSKKATRVKKKTSESEVE